MQNFHPSQDNMPSSNKQSYLFKLVGINHDIRDCPILNAHFSPAHTQGQVFVAMVCMEQLLMISQAFPCQRLANLFACPDAHCDLVTL